MVFNYLALVILATGTKKFILLQTFSSEHYNAKYHINSKRTEIEIKKKINITNNTPKSTRKKQ
ncbi:hypothetical protein, partial [Klebsiella pneumoniae]|uniref:hypothetical protein n=1 Tax=Klebsiella pneumoniae TaxID=573 RepID=UPI00272FEB7B